MFNSTWLKGRSQKHSESIPGTVPSVNIQLYLAEVSEALGAKNILRATQERFPVLIFNSTWLKCRSQKHPESNPGTVPSVNIQLYLAEVSEPKTSWDHHRNCSHCSALPGWSVGAKNILRTTQKQSSLLFISTWLKCRSQKHPESNPGTVPHCSSLAGQ